MIKNLIVSCFLLDNMGHKTSISVHGFRHDTINIKRTKFDVNVSQMRNPVDF